VSLGVKIVIFDCKEKIIKEKITKTLADFRYDGKEIYVCTSGNKISVLDLNLNIKRSLTNKPSKLH